ncbi:beta-1,4-galactosyltransferase 7-like isoform X2 [Planococcus citri]
MDFIPHMNAFLKRQKIKFYFIIVHHVSDGNQFNRGSTFNAGVQFITEDFQDCDYLALHDIDLLPLSDDISYAYPGDTVLHMKKVDNTISGFEYDPLIFAGGILLISIEQYTRVNGFSNRFWGCEGEDINFDYRLSNNSVTKTHPINLSTGDNDTFKWIHSPNRAKDHYIHCAASDVDEIKKHDSETGLHDVKYKLVSVRYFDMNEIPFTMYNIKITCNVTETPWCKPNIY